jgi:hypothetical protein
MQATTAYEKSVASLGEEEGIKLLPTSCDDIASRRADGKRSATRGDCNNCAIIRGTGEMAGAAASAE